MTFFFFYNTLLLLFASGFAFCSSLIVFPSAAARCESNDQQPEAFCRETNCSKESSEGLSGKHSFEKKINPGKTNKETITSLHYICAVVEIHSIDFCYRPSTSKSESLEPGAQ